MIYLVHKPYREWNWGTHEGRPYRKRNDLVHKPYRERNSIVRQGNVSLDRPFRTIIVVQRKPERQQRLGRERHTDERCLIHALGVVTSPKGNEIRCHLARRFVQRSSLRSPMGSNLAP